MGQVPGTRVSEIVSRTPTAMVSQLLQLLKLWATFSSHPTRKSLRSPVYRAMAVVDSFEVILQRTKDFQLHQIQFSSSNS